jgi:hypothetical protein
MLFRRVDGVKKKALFGKVPVACWQKQDVLRAPVRDTTQLTRAPFPPASAARMAAR